MCNLDRRQCTRDAARKRGFSNGHGPMSVDMTNSEAHKRRRKEKRQTLTPESGWDPRHGVARGTFQICTNGTAAACHSLPIVGMKTQAKTRPESRIPCATDAQHRQCNQCVTQSCCDYRAIYDVELVIVVYTHVVTEYSMAAFCGSHTTCYLTQPHRQFV